MHVYNIAVFLCCAVLILGLTEGRLWRTRRGSCEFGTYQHEGKTCCLCQKGYRVLKHCTDESQTQCELCGDYTFTDHNNNEDKCQPCKVCDSNANMATKVRCSKYSDTVCGCKDNYYCEKGDLCKACYPCDTCDEHGEKQHCTETNNTVCNEPVHPQSKTTGAVVAVFVSLILLAAVGVLVLYIKRKHKLCFKLSKNTMENGEDIHLNDLDLNPHLSEIADVLGWKTMKRVAQWTGMSKTDIEEQELNHPNNAKDQTYALLQAWSQSQGLHGAYPELIKTLRRMKQRRTADEIRKIVEK